MCDSLFFFHRRALCGLRCAAYKVHATLYKMDSVDKREKCLQRRRERERSRRASETAEEREERLRKRRVRDRARRAAQSASAREIDLQQRRERSAAESPESREARLQRMRDRVAAETDEDREGRLQQMSDRQRDRLVAETVEEREARLQQMRDRLATETVEEREARLQQMRDRLATETVEEREARLQQMSDHQRDRLAAETPEQRQARLHHRSQRPLFEQPCVQTKMAKFHAHMSTLDISTCTTCTSIYLHVSLRLAPKMSNICLVIGASLSESHIDVKAAIFSICTSNKNFILKYFRCRDGKRTETRIGMEGICITHSCIPLYTVCQNFCY